MTTELTPAEKTAAAIDRAVEKMNGVESPIAQATSVENRYQRAARVRRETFEKKFADRRHKVKVLFDQGLSITLIAERLGITLAQVDADLARLGLHRDPASRLRRTVKTERRKEIARRVTELRQQGWEINPIAVELGVSRSMVQSVLTEAGLTKPKPKASPDVIAARRKRAGELRAQGLSIQRIADELDTTTSVIGRDLQVVGVTPPGAVITKKTKARDERRAEVKRLYTIEGFYIKQIAEEMGIADTTVQSDITAMGLNRSNGQFGRTNAQAMVNTVANAIQHMLDMSVVVRQQEGLRGLSDLSPERKQELLGQLSHVGKVTNQLRKILRQEGNTTP